MFPILIPFGFSCVSDCNICSPLYWLFQRLLKDNGWTSCTNLLISSAPICPRRARPSHEAVCGCRVYWFRIEKRECLTLNYGRVDLGNQHVCVVNVWHVCHNDSYWLRLWLSVGWISMLCNHRSMPVWCRAWLISEEWTFAAGWLTVAMCISIASHFDFYIPWSLYFDIYFFNSLNCLTNYIDLSFIAVCATTCVLKKT